MDKLGKEVVLYFKMREVRLGSSPLIFKIIPVIKMPTRISFNCHQEPNLSFKWFQLRFHLVNQCYLDFIGTCFEDESKGLNSKDKFEKVH